MNMDSLQPLSNSRQKEMVLFKQMPVRRKVTKDIELRKRPAITPLGKVGDEVEQNEAKNKKPKGKKK